MCCDTEQLEVLNAHVSSIQLLMKQDIEILYDSAVFRMCSDFVQLKLIDYCIRKSI
jgi:hypothetical protein